MPSVLQFPLERIVDSAKQTADLAARFAQNLTAGDFVALYGDLGAGKTFFTQAICRALQTDQPATSPTFTIMNQYLSANGMEVYHFDFYRLEHEAEMINLGFDEYFYGQGICLVEWADRIEAHLPERRYRVDIFHQADDPNSRKIRISLQPKNITISAD